MSEVACPLCAKSISSFLINTHIDSGCMFGVQAAGGPRARLKRTASRDDEHDGAGAGDGDGENGHRAKKPRYESGEPGSSAEAAMSRPSATAARPAAGAHAPLAERMRPTRLDEMFGQPAVAAGDSLLGALLASGRAVNLILHGPPGCGKTTLASVIGHAVAPHAHYRALSATVAKLADVRAELDRARNSRGLDGKPTVLFVDEIHRFSKLQQVRSNSAGRGAWDRENARTC